jgi:hypothetical protein
MSCTTIIITPEQNRSLSLLTCNRDNDFKIYAHTNEKYQHLNIQLVKKMNGARWYEKNVQPESNYIETPKELLEYETQFLVV